MPSAAQHQDKYDNNRQYLDGGLVTTNPIWSVVVAFYCAVHLVEKLAALESPPRHHRKHNDRDIWLSRRHRSIYDDYSALKDASECSRYGTLHQFARMYPASVIQHLITTNLKAIEDYVIAQHPPSPPPAPPSATKP